MADPRSIAILLQKELREAWRNRWFLLFSAAFAVLALAMSWISMVGVMNSGFAGLGRTAAGLVNLVMLVVPLMGLTLGASAIAGERERGSLEYLLAQPVDCVEVVLGKFLGLVAAIVAALLLGFGVAGLVIAGGGAGGDLAVYLGFLGLALLMAAAMVSLGLLVSALSGRTSVAAGIGLFLWLGLILLGDLGLMGTALVLKLDAGQLLALALANPLQVFKIACILTIRGGLEVLGPAGLYAVRTYGDSLVPLLVTVLLLWVALPLLATALLMRRRGGVA